MTDSSPPIVAFIETRLAEDEEIARAAMGGDGRWHAIDLCEEGITILDGDDDGSPDAGYSYHPPRNHQTAQITRHSPARVLRQCAAQRELLAIHVPREIWLAGLGGDDEQVFRCEVCTSGHESVPWPCATLRAVANVWSDHPDFQPEWLPAD